ncbi:hypothetical protein PFLUV_G00093100 [Perca fluviatilis]|uniref:TTF-type domain-containing protein n=1 Tax=Perca fluviatilis TaxID=8168 RepID=A0A6A5FA35_PERFL|nr:hypothetical protein PFLUV_G00093100 [Perca fluviatilis]
MAPLSPPPPPQDVGWSDAWPEQDVDTHHRPKPRGCPARRCFRKAWLKKFWFLRYSPDLDQMWCHVCRLHSDSLQPSNGLVRGSRVFKFHNIKVHNASSYHQDNVARHMLHMCDLQLGGAGRQNSPL